MSSSQALFFVKSALFIALSAIFYIFYLTEIIKKYADGYTYFLTYQETMVTVTPPFFQDKNVLIFQNHNCEESLDISRKIIELSCNDLMKGGEIISNLFSNKY